VAVFFFVLAIGAFITVTIKTGALDAGIARVTDRFSACSPVIVTGAETMDQILRRRDRNRSLLAARVCSTSLGMTVGRR